MIVILFLQIFKKNEDIMKEFYQIRRNLIILSIFSKIRIDTELKISTYTNISKAIEWYITLCYSLKFHNLYMFKVCRHFGFLSIFSKNIIDTKLKNSMYTKLLTSYPMIYHLYL